MNNKKASLTIIVISVLVLSIAIVISISVTKPPKLSLDSLEDDVETTRGAMIYPTKTGGDEWFMDPSKLNEDKRFDANANLPRNEDGSWSVDSKEQTRLQVWSKSSGEFRSKRGMNTYNHSIIESRGYWYKPSD
jgi:hypothetical protein